MSARWSPRVTVAAVVTDGDRYLLVEERIDGRLVLNQPAGHLERGESLVQAVERETLEETGWTIRVSGVLALSLYRAPDGLTFQRTTFLAEPLLHDPLQPLDPPVVRALWLHTDGLAVNSDRMRSPLVMAVIEQHRRGRVFPLDVLLDADSKA